jgi:hypothetical protein
VGPVEAHPRCPVCEASTNTYGLPLVSEWAVACHVAGKALSGERLHKSWIREATEAEVDGHVPSLAEAILPKIRRAIKEALERSKFTPDSPFDFICDLEVKLHGLVRQSLKQEFGDDESGWWVQGVPVKIRQECQARREADDAREEAFAYAFLIDLKAIIERNSRLFDPLLKSVAIEGRRLSLKDFIAWLVRINEMRNRYAHPVRAPKRASRSFEEDLQIAKQAWQVVDQLCQAS